MQVLDPHTPYGPPSATTYRGARLFPAALGVALCLTALVGCPSTTTPPVQILEVEVVGDPTTTAFMLEIEGRGFGLQSVRYDPGGSVGTSSTTELSLRIATRGGAFARILRRSALTVLSPRRLDATVDLDSPLPEGIYSLELFDGDVVLATEDTAFEVERTGPTPDGGAPDAGDTRPDAGQDAGVDAGPFDGGQDAGAPDAGPPDSGLGPFPGNFTVRRAIDLGGAAVPAGATVRIPVPHAAMITAGEAEADGRDLFVYQGTDPLSFQWDDRFEVGSDQLAMIVQPIRPVPVGGDPADPLVLYSGNPGVQNTPSDGVFAFVERFRQELAPIDQGNDNAWTRADGWGHCNADRPIEMPLPQDDPTQRQSYCFVSTEGGFVRRTLATPRLDLSNAPGAGLTYEMSFWLAGQNFDGPLDALYFSYWTDNDSFDQTLELPTPAWLSFPPTVPFMFEDIDNDPRTVDAWQFSQPVMDWWTRARARFVPMVDRPSLHFRYVSGGNTAQDPSVALLDDWWVRLAPDPAPVVNLGAPETRN